MLQLFRTVPPTLRRRTRQPEVVIQVGMACLTHTTEAVTTFFPLITLQVLPTVLTPLAMLRLPIPGLASRRTRQLHT